MSSSEMAASPQVHEAIRHETNLKQLNGKGVVVDGIDESAASHQPSTLTSIASKRNIGDQPQSQSIVRSKVSLAHVIQQAEGCTQQNGWSSRRHDLRNRMIPIVQYREMDCKLHYERIDHCNSSSLCIIKIYLTKLKSAILLSKSDIE